nr:MAG TPA: hypothetical protein [Caudoviricetes sp.]
MRGWGGTILCKELSCCIRGNARVICSRYGLWF